ncbi:MAG: hypothetical protein JST22_15855 [Bacteroidetes bacterium]|nr:hypothetical protein [Bacteroidota bacterium]
MYPRIDDVIRGLEWAIVRKPEKGLPLRYIDGITYFLWKTYDSSDVEGAPVGVTAVYFFDDNTVTIFALRVIDR